MPSFLLYIFTDENKTNRTRIKTGGHANTRKFQV